MIITSAPIGALRFRYGSQGIAGKRFVFSFNNAWLNTTRL